MSAGVKRCKGDCGAALERLTSVVICPDSERRNHHPRDLRISFEEKCHLYKLDAETCEEQVFPISVSGLWGMYFEQFNAGQIIQDYYDMWCSDPQSKYYEMIEAGRASGQCDVLIQQSIRLTWEWNGLLASAAGTRMHKQIELALRGCLYDSHCVESRVFLDFLSTWLEPRFWTVYRLEWSIFCEHPMVAGQIDALFQCGSEFHMIDWKRCCKVLDPDAGIQWGRYGAPPLDGLLDNSCNHYFMQQNLYAVILQKCYGIEVQSMHLVQIHPSLPTFKVVEVPDLRVLAASILEARVARVPEMRIQEKLGGA